jgi:hypothetical protein
MKRAWFVLLFGIGACADGVTSPTPSNAPHIRPSGGASDAGPTAMPKRPPKVSP